jgi:hypothetical protein
MMEAVGTSETSVENYFTRQYIPKDNSEHHTRRRENFKSQMPETYLSRKTLLTANGKHFLLRYFYSHHISKNMIREHTNMVGRSV